MSTTPVLVRDVPPKLMIGLKPEAAYARQKNANVVSRALEIAEAIHRTARLGNPVPIEWAAELERRILEITT